MAAEHIRKPRESDLTPAQRARVDAIRAKNRRQSTGQMKPASGKTSSASTETRRPSKLPVMERPWDPWWNFAVSSCHFAGSGSARGSPYPTSRSAEIDKAALSRLENGQQLNPTVNTLARYAGALGSTLKFALGDPEQDPSGTPRSADRVTHKGLDPNG